MYEKPGISRLLITLFFRSTNLHYPNGYRSYHIILGIPVYCLDGMEYFPVEIQFRTMSMDFWASMEHRINYKKERQDREKLVKELKEHARKLEKIEKSFEKYSENVQNSVS